MTTLTEQVHGNEGFVSEAAGNRAREACIVKSGQSLVSMAVIALVISASTVASAVKASGANTGNGTFVVDATTPALVNAQLGVYQLRCITAGTNTGTFQLFDPYGVSLGSYIIPAGAGGSITIANQIKGALTDGSTDFAVGDGFDITVSALSVQAVEYNPAGTDGSQFAAGVLYRAVDASSAARPGVYYARDCELSSALLGWKSGATAAQKAKGAQDLKRLGIILR